ncbi:MAG: nitrilase-related carbon-nitrogen hydrolase, partial [bacterium]
MTKQNNLNVALIQSTSTGPCGDIRSYLEQQIRSAAHNGAQLVVLQELHNTNYFCQTENPDLFDLAETIPGPSTHWFTELALQLNIVIIGSLFEKRTSGIYHNTAIVIDRDGSLAGMYRKMHIPDDPGFY